MSEIEVGALVVSINEKNFRGVGKVIEAETGASVVVGFWRSPLQPSAGLIKLSEENLKPVRLYDEKVVFYFDEETSYWRRARYGGSRPGGLHLIIFSSKEHRVVSVDEIFVCNSSTSFHLDPMDYLYARCCDTAFFSEYRIPFIQSYVKQRAACRSLAAIPSSSIELEVHQLAIVRRVLQDPTRRYLLADEVGLGKTVEAGLILREVILRDDLAGDAVVAVPAALQSQWLQELGMRFHLEDLIDRRVHVVSHEEMWETVAHFKPGIVIIDEAHQISPWAWMQNTQDSDNYRSLVEAVRSANTLLLLSGTPLSGNEKNYLSMLHMLSPDQYPIDEEGISAFLEKVELREKLGGIHQALDGDSDNDSIFDLLDELSQLFPGHSELLHLIEELRPHVDFDAPANSEARNRLIGTIRDYVGENFKLHRRMLRNRREDPTVAQLFPGLQGGKICSYQASGEAYSIEQYLEDYRSAHSPLKMGAVIDERCFLMMVELALIAPMAVGACAADLLIDQTSRLVEAERDLLTVVAQLAPVEQRAKDAALAEEVRRILDDHSRNKVVIFCSRAEIADHVAEVVRLSWSGRVVERHDPQDSLKGPSFCSNSNVRVLVCDVAGEDGLNLHGGRKHIVHYSLPLSLPRVEQRIGRVNRYSAAIHAAPVSNCVLTSAPAVYSENWAQLLEGTLGVFDKSIASLQFVLEDEIARVWAALPVEGLQCLARLHETLAGPSGLIQIETKRYKVQEELNSMEAEIQLAEVFARELQDADDEVEESSAIMMDWITKGLQFRKTPYEDDESIIRFKYVSFPPRGGPTLIDFSTFVRLCQTGFSERIPSRQEAFTAPMSAERGRVSHGRGIYPMRFGQPFIDVVYTLLDDDPRGICSAIERVLRDCDGNQSLCFLEANWLIELDAMDPGCPVERRMLDEKYPPKTVGAWFDVQGEEVANTELLKLLRAPYKRGAGGAYRDQNIRAEMWAELEPEFPKEEWTRLIRRMSSHWEGHLEQYSAQWSGLLSHKLIGVKFIALRGHSLCQT